MGTNQSCPGRNGTSASEAKLKCIKMPRDLSGKSVLDLGCNEGFFAIEAKKRGASYVLGVDINPTCIEAAKIKAAEHNVDIDFMCADLTSPRRQRFDLILLLSTLHYIDSPIGFLRGLRNSLAPSGRLIVECGIAPGVGRTVLLATRSIDVRFFPTLEMFKNIWLSPFAVRNMGRSADPAGDPVHHHVFHCRFPKTNVLFIQGKGGVGKSILASQINSAPVISTDRLFQPFADKDVRSKSAEHNTYLQLLNERRSIRITWDEIKSNESIRKYFMATVARAIRICNGIPLVVVEGYVLKDLVQDLVLELSSEFKCWVAGTGEQKHNAD